jgi:hypothetical protein
MWPWHHHIYGLCWVMFLLPWKLSIMNMLGQVYTEVANFACHCHLPCIFLEVKDSFADPSGRAV